MKKIERNNLKIYLRPILVILLTTPLGIWSIKVYMDEMNKNGNTESTPLMYVACILLIAAGYYDLIKRLKKSPKIFISKDKLITNKYELQLSDIKHFKLTGKYYYDFGGRYRTKELRYREGMEITFKNGKVIHFHDEFYNNLNELKLLLKEKFITKNELINSVSYTQYKKYRNSQFFKLRGILTWAFISYYTINKLFISDNNNINGKILIISSCIFIFFWQSKFMYYFIFENKKLIIRNENFLWINHEINLNEIEEVVFEKDVMIIEQLKRKHIRIILKNHKQYKYGADLLRKSMWENMKIELNKLDIIVRDEF